MIRHCDGADPGLTLRVLRTHFNPGRMTRNPQDDQVLGTDYAIVNCDCGATFDDAERQAAYPHDLHPPATGAAR